MNLRHFFVLITASLIFSSVAIAKESLERDVKTFNYLFRLAAERGGPLALKCGEPKVLNWMMDSLDILEDGYRSLNRKFPEYLDVRGQVAKRNEIVCGLLDCGKVDPEYWQCAPNTMFGYQNSQQEFKVELERLEMRLSKLKTRQSEKKSSVGVSQSSNVGCAGKAQYYQDAYERSGRVDDLICMKKAFEREIR